MHLIVFDWVRFPNPIEHNQMDRVRLSSIFSIEFDLFGNRTHWKSGVRFRSIAELNRTQSTDWVRLSSIFERSIDYAGWWTMFEICRVTYIHIYVQNKCKVASIVVCCRPCSSKRRILVIYWVFAMLSTVNNKRRTREETGFRSGPAPSRFSHRNSHRPTSKPRISKAEFPRFNFFSYDSIENLSNTRSVSRR